MVLPSGPLRDEHGELFEFDADANSSTTVLFVSSPHCDLCELATPHWNRASETLASSGARAIGLILEVEPEDLRSTDYAYPVVATEDLGAKLFRYLDGVPATLFVGADGVVDGVVYGDEQLGLADEVLSLLAREPAD